MLARVARYEVPPDRCDEAVEALAESAKEIADMDGFQNGYVFVDSKITSDSGITGSVLARIDVNEYPGSHVAYIDCMLGSHISSAGWTITGGSPGSSLRFWEYGSTDSTGASLDTSGRVQGSTRISAEQAAAMRDPANVLDGWSP